MAPALLDVRDFGANASVSSHSFQNHAHLGWLEAHHSSSGPSQHPIQERISKALGTLSLLAELQVGVSSF